MVGRNISVSIKNNDIEWFSWLAGNLPRQHSISSFFMESTKKGVQELRRQKTIDIQAFINKGGLVPPDIFLAVPEFKNRLKNMPNNDLKTIQKMMQEKLNLLNREALKRIG